MPNYTQRIPSWKKGRRHRRANRRVSFWTDLGLEDVGASVSILGQRVQPNMQRKPPYQQGPPLSAPKS